jgi:Tfp pilus assembly protein PilF
MKKILDYIEKQEYEKAMILVEEALNKTPDVLELMCAKAEILKKQNKFTDAVNQYIRVIEKHPEHKKAQIEKDLLHTVMLKDNLDIFASTNLFDDPWEII